jgi:hypothetical protein
MTIVFKGGTSGNREDAIFPMPTSPATPQPILRTQTSGLVPSTVVFNAEHFDVKTHREQATPDFMPTGGTHAGPNDAEGAPSSDYCQQDIKDLKFDPAQGEGKIFRGAPNLGVSLAPQGSSEDGAS